MTIRKLFFFLSLPKLIVHIFFINHVQSCSTLIKILFYEQNVQFWAKASIPLKMVKLMFSIRMIINTQETHLSRVKHFQKISETISINLPDCRVLNYFFYSFIKGVYNPVCSFDKKGLAADDLSCNVHFKHFWYQKGRIRGKYIFFFKF